MAEKAMAAAAHKGRAIRLIELTWRGLIFLIAAGFLVVISTRWTT